MEIETVNRLYLELSQFVTAKTKRDLELEALLAAVRAFKAADSVSQGILPAASIEYLSRQWRETKAALFALVEESDNET